MLNVSPFTYGMRVMQIYDNGTVFSPNILDIDEETLLGFYLQGVRNIAALSLAAGYPTVASVAHSIVNGYKNVLAVSVETDYTFAGSEKIKAYLADPSAFAVAATPADTGASGGAAAAAAKEEEPEESEDDDMGFGLFD